MTKSTQFCHWIDVTLTQRVKNMSLKITALWLVDQHSRWDHRTHLNRFCHHSVYFWCQTHTNACFLCFITHVDGLCVMPVRGLWGSAEGWCHGWWCKRSLFRAFISEQPAVNTGRISFPSADGTGRDGTGGEGISLTVWLGGTGQISLLSS